MVTEGGHVWQQVGKFDSAQPLVPNNTKALEISPTSKTFRHVCTSEAQLAVAESRVVCRAFFLHLSATAVTFDAFIELGPAMSARVFLQPLFLRSSVLEPHLTERIVKTAALIIVDGSSRAGDPKTLNRGPLFTCTTLMSSPVSEDSCSLTWRAGFGEFL